MKSLLEVCLVALTFVAGTTHSGIAQILVRRSDSSAPPMQPGISVKLPITRYARSMPDADQQDSLIVSVTADGNSYFGIDPITPTTLAGKLKTLSGQTEKKLYVKADARTSYVHVLEILDVIEAAGICELALLTAQPEVVKPGTRMPPKGLEVLVGAPLVASSRPAVIELVYSLQGSPALKINGQNIPLRSLESRLRQYLNPQTQKVVLLEADGQLPFARVVDVAGRCRSAGAKVVLHSDAEKASATDHGAMMRGSAALGPNG